MKPLQSDVTYWMIMYFGALFLQFITSFWLFFKTRAARKYKKQALEFRKACAFALCYIQRDRIKEAERTLDEAIHPEINN